MHKKENYLIPEVEIFKICLEESILQASTQGFTNDLDFDPSFFGLV